MAHQNQWTQFNEHIFTRDLSVHANKYIHPPPPHTKKKQQPPPPPRIVTKDVNLRSFSLLMLNHFYNDDCSNEPLLKRCSLACKNLKICILVSLYKQIICFGTDLVKYGTSLLLFLFKAYTFYMTFCEWCFYLVRFLISFSAHVLTIFLGLCLQ